MSSGVDEDVAWEYVEEHEDEILMLFDMYQELEETGSDDYTEIDEYKEEYLLKDYPYIEIYYYKYSDKMELWFDLNHDGYDWGVVYNPDSEFDVNSVPHVDAYEDMGNGFYIHMHLHGF